MSPTESRSFAIRVAMNMGKKPPLALIAGPTASGKSALALALAERSGGVIINADSAQVYRDLRVVSARPTAEDEARAPHRLYGYRDGADLCSAADWAVDAKAVIAEAHQAGRLPIIVGGTGLYIRTLLEGIAPVPEIDPEIRRAVRELPVVKAHAALAREDAEAATRLRPTDTTRVARALEVVRSTGRPLATWQADRTGGIGAGVALRPLILLPPRNWLHARCDARFETIFSEGGIVEVRGLIDRHLPVAAPVMRAIGVREIAAFLRGEMMREEALAAGKTATRQYAKRQYTWFRRQPPPEWPRFVETPDTPAVRAELVEALSFSSTAGKESPSTSSGRTG
jgi:tRNA dimethylallyltransferase